MNEEINITSEEDINRYCYVCGPEKAAFIISGCLWPQVVVPDKCKDAFDNTTIKGTEL